MIKPSHYDSDGYVIQWWRSAMPSNSLAQLFGLASDCANRRVLGDDVELELTALDETNTRINVRKIVARIRRDAGGLVGLVGVQSNEFPRALELARQFRACGLPVCMGGFHPSGCLAMLSDIPPDLQEALDIGVSLFAGEAEGRLEQVLIDAWRGQMPPIYNYMNDLPGLEDAETPILPVRRVKRTVEAQTSFDAGRGCPFQCSFCTIINVQGRKSRYRSADDIERLVRANLEQDVRRFFITDDNFARNRNWEAILDRLALIKEQSDVAIKFTIQVDTLCHLIPGFIEKARRAGVNRVFIGLEAINPENLTAANKRQNRITEYRKMLQAWKDIGAVTYCGYILGFPKDTPRRILRDIEIIKRELPIDLLEFFCLTPLPGSADHQDLYRRGVWMDPDLNKYDLEHVTANHPLMSKDEWQDIYHRAWDAYYTPEHVETILRRAAARGMSVGKMVVLLYEFYVSVSVERLHPLQSGLFRRKIRTTRRPGLPIENPLRFYPKRLSQIVSTNARYVALALKYRRIYKRVKRDPDRRDYVDQALTPVKEAELSRLEIFTGSGAARRAVDRRPRKAAEFEAEERHP